MFKRVKPTYEHNSGVDHPDKQCINTRVSEYLRKYGTGQLEKLPTDTRQEIKDDRSDDEKLAEGRLVPGLGTDALDVMMEMDRQRERLAEIESAIDETSADFKKFQKAKSILDNPNASDDAKYDAYRIIAELENKGRVTRARD